jgi:hypothetical protein
MQFYCQNTIRPKKKILNYAYVLKNGVDRYNIFFFYSYTNLTDSSFLCRFRVESVNVLLFHDSICAMCTFSSSTNNFAHAQTLSRMSSLSGRMIIARVNIEHFTGCKKIKQWRISFVLGYFRMIWTISTAISIKHRILATFNNKQNKFWQPVCL